MSRHAVRRGAAGLALLALAGAAPAGSAGRGPAVTVYSRDLGYVRESRTLEPVSGDTVRIADVPAALDFSSVRLVPAAGRVRRLAWRFDVEQGDRLLEATRGSRVRVVSKGDRVTEGILLAADGAWLVVRTDDGGVSTLSRAAVEEIRLPKPSGQLSLRPTIEAVVEDARRGTTAELSYLTGGLSWSAEHVLVRQGETAGTWSASATVENTTGRDFVDAELKLIAGDLRRDGGMPPPMPLNAMRMVTQEKGQAADLAEQGFSEYHLYALDRPATLRDREAQRLTMVDPVAVKLRPLYLYRGGGTTVAAQLELVNAKGSGPGVPLPGGRVRVYEPDAAGALQLAGEPRIGHTAVDEKLTLDLGTAFDLAAERRTTEQKRISDREREYAVEIELRNRKKTAVTIVCEEPVGGEFTVLRNSHKYTRKDASTLRFEVPVEAGGKATLSYAVRVRY